MDDKIDNIEKSIIKTGRRKDGKLRNTTKYDCSTAEIQF